MHALRCTAIDEWLIGCGEEARYNTTGTKHNKLNLLDETIDPHIVDGVLAIVVDALGGLRRRRRRRAALSEARERVARMRARIPIQRVQGLQVAVLDRVKLVGARPIGGEVVDGQLARTITSRINASRRYQSGPTIEALL